MKVTRAASTIVSKYKIDQNQASGFFQLTLSSIKLTPLPYYISCVFLSFLSKGEIYEDTRTCTGVELGDTVNGPFFSLTFTLSPASFNYLKMYWSNLILF